jgi:hypothetical protein
MDRTINELSQRLRELATLQTEFSKDTSGFGWDIKTSINTLVGIYSNMKDLKESARSAEKELHSPSTKEERKTELSKQLEEQKKELAAAAKEGTQYEDLMQKANSYREKQQQTASFGQSVLGEHGSIRKVGKLRELKETATAELPPSLPSKRAAPPPEAPLPATSQSAPGRLESAAKESATTPSTAWNRFRPTALEKPSTQKTAPTKQVGFAHLPPPPKPPTPEEVRIAGIRRTPLPPPPSLELARNAPAITEKNLPPPPWKTATVKEKSTHTLLKADAEAKKMPPPHAGQHRRQAQKAEAPEQTPGRGTRG